MVTGVALWAWPHPSHPVSPPGRLNVKNEELDAMIKEASGPINFTVFLTMFGEKLKGADPEDVIMGAFKVLDPDGKGSIKKKL
nr:PREDICTED: myosin regulatory light chain 2, skeletal muscle isoform-like [Apteryx mantelli mantelli]